MPTSDTWGTRARGVWWRWIGVALTAVGVCACGNEGTREPTPTLIGESLADENLADASLGNAYRQLFDGNAEAVAQSFEAARAKGRELDDVAALAHATLGLGDALTVTGDWAKARDAYQQVEASTDRVHGAAASARMSWLDGRKSASDDRQAARARYEDSLATARQLGDRWLEVRIIASRADLASFSEHPEETLPELREAGRDMDHSGLEYRFVVTNGT